MTTLSTLKTEDDKKVIEQPSIPNPQPSNQKNTEGPSLLHFDLFGYTFSIEKKGKEPLNRRNTNWQVRAYIVLAFFGISLIFNLLLTFFTAHEIKDAVFRIDPLIYKFIFVGFLAQTIDGLLGMGYGVTSQIALMSLNISPAAIGSSIHTAEIFSSGASGFSHYKFGNVNKKLFKVLVIPGILGAIFGALMLTYLGEKYAMWVKPLLAVYAMILGIRILSRAFAQTQKKKKIKNAGWLALAGGFLDSFGGGGWGPLVTSTLISKGRSPQYVIGSVSASEFFMTFASAVTFFATIGISHWQVIIGLIIGGVVAAPFSARLAGKLPIKWMFIGVGCMVIFWSFWILRKMF
jgi:uncharacterized protein